MSNQPIHPSMRTRRLYMTEADWRGFADALAAAFPMFRYYDLTPFERFYDPTPFEKTVFHKHMFDLPGIDAKCDAMAVFDEDRYEANMQWEVDDRGVGRWVVQKAAGGKRRKNPYFMIRIWHMFGHTLQQKWKMLPQSDCTFYSAPGNRDQEAMSRRFYRLLGKLCTNRNQVSFDLPSRKVTHLHDKGSLFWFGHDAIRWANEDPQHYMHYAEHSAMRPMDPKNPPTLGSII